MIIQSKRIWVLGQFIEAQLELEDGKIKNVLAYGAKPADKDYGERRIVPGFIDAVSYTHLPMRSSRIKRKCSDCCRN